MNGPARVFILTLCTAAFLILIFAGEPALAQPPGAEGDRHMMTVGQSDTALNENTFLLAGRIFQRHTMSLTVHNSTPTAWDVKMWSPNNQYVLMLTTVPTYSSAQDGEHTMEPASRVLRGFPLAARIGVYLLL